MGAGGGGSQRVAQAWHGRNTPQRYGRSIADGYTGSTDGEAAFIRDRDLIGAPSGAHPRHGGWGRLGNYGLIRQLSACNVVQGARPLKIGGPGGVPKNRHVV